MVRIPVADVQVRGRSYVWMVTLVSCLPFAATASAAGSLCWAVLVEIAMDMDAKYISLAAVCRCKEPISCIAGYSPQCRWSCRLGLSTITISNLAHFSFFSLIVISLSRAVIRESQPWKSYGGGMDKLV
ncbi:hypothetical protein MPH_02507 [Macrophomina phaseolina MS6]|uniref:Uncharacterized protein n=1 Tax=Macrophomina phaseolina (strain MS6) TaxID=1126212 RepID=K2STU5_MACPH|nr:hypothetical protein MPH_02507 [Macrophomina phaseolina MS6]